MRILIVKLSSLGDLFHALPTVHAVKTGFDADIDWVVTDSYRELVSCFDDVDRVIPFPRHGTLPRLAPFLRALRRERYDIVLDLQGLLKSACVTWLARGKRRLGPSTHREGSHLFYTENAAPPRPAPQAPRHAVEACLDSLALLRLRRPATPVFPVTFPPYRLDQPRPWIAVAPASRWVTKNWPPERFAAAAGELQREHGGTILLVGGPIDRPLCERIAGRVNGPVENAAGRLSLVETGGLLQAADILLSNDSGPSHIAAAAGTPCVVVFGPTDPARTGPYGTGHRNLKTAIKCAPCFKQRCRHADIPCINGVQTYQVVEAAGRILRPEGRAGGAGRAPTAPAGADRA